MHVCHRPPTRYNAGIDQQPLHHVLASPHLRHLMVGACACRTPAPDRSLEIIPPIASRARCLRSRVGVHLPLATGHGDVHETAGVRDSLLRAALGGLLLLLGLDLWGVALAINIYELAILSNSSATAGLCHRSCRLRRTEKVGSMRAAAAAGAAQHMRMQDLEPSAESSLHLGIFE